MKKRRIMYEYETMCVETGKRYKSILSAQKDFNPRGGSIRDCICGRQKKAYGYHWMLVDQDIQNKLL